MYRSAILILVVSAVTLVVAGCGSIHQRLKTASLTMSPLAPEGTSGGSAGVPQKRVQIKATLRVGLAFAPLPAQRSNSYDISSQAKQDLLEKVRKAFEDVSFVEALEVIPSTYLKEGAEFESLAAATQAFNLDAVAFVTYDQEQFSDTTNWSILYWTLIGLYLVPGEKNETHTLLDASVVAVNPRMMLLHAAGSDKAQGWRTPMHVRPGLRNESEKSFERATERLIADLRRQLDKTQADIKEGRGLQGIPVAFVTEAGVVTAGSGTSGQGGGAGDLGWFGTALLLIMGLGCALKRRNAGRC